MNSLTYLSRQFDVLASPPSTPPSTPTSECVPLLPHDAAGNASIKRTNTWSTKSFLTPISLSPSFDDESTFRLSGRSFSSPAGFAAPSVSPSDAEKSEPLPLNDTIIPPPTTHQSILRRLFLVRVFLMLWNTVCASLALLTRIQLRDSFEEELDTSADEKESEIEDSRDDNQHAQSVLLVSSASQSPPVVSSQHQSQPFTLSSSIRNPILSHSNSNLPTESYDQTLSPNPLPPHLLTSTPPPVLSSTPPPSSTPMYAGARKTPFHLPKTLVLDLDETLIHSTTRPMYATATSGSGLLGLGGFRRKESKGAYHTVEVVLGGRSTLYHVYKRPFVDYFLRKVSGWYTLVIFTASMQEYADPVIDWLDAGRGMFGRRFFRESCTQLPNGSYTKDLSIIEQDLARVCLVDNSPISYDINQANGIPIEGWTHDPADEALLDLLPVLDSLRFTGDVRRVLGIRGFGVS